MWGDEADTAIFARGVWTTGDTSAEWGDNLYAFRNGLLLDDLHNRYMPPLSFYLAAPFYGLGGNSAAVMRLPFALCGWLSLVLIVVWLNQARASTSTWIVLAIAWLCDVSFILFARQCRYYALALLLSMLVGWLYVREPRSRWTLGWMAAALVALMATHFIAYAALVAGLVVDYAIWRRRVDRLDVRGWLVLLIPQAIAAALFVAVGYHVGREPLGDIAKDSWLFEKATLLLWNFRDLSVCEFGAGLLMVLAPLVAWRVNDTWLLRAVTALVVYVAAVTLVSPQPVSRTYLADIRYLAPTLPLCGFISVRTLLILTGRRLWLAVPLALVAFGTNVMNLPVELAHWRSSPWELVCELLDPQPPAVSEAIDWIDAHVAAGESIWLPPPALPSQEFHSAGQLFVDPDTYSLFFHAPHAVYGWQVSDPPTTELAGVAAIQIVGREPVDVIVSLNDATDRIARLVIGAYRRQGIDYEQVARWKGRALEQTRPELFFHVFRPRADDRSLDTVRVYRRRLY